MIAAPLPLAPRPYPGEAVSSWVRRIGARYDIMADDLVEYVLDRPGRSVGVASMLDYQAVPDLEAALANATRLSPLAISHLRIAGDDGANACWHRSALAWCPICIRADLAGHGELYERASWRLGSCVVCPEHNVPLEDSCCRCPFEDRCHFYCSGGLLGLACNSCKRPEGPEPRRTREWWEDDRAGAFGTCITPELNRLIGTLQSDLQAAFRGAPPRHAWGFLRSANGLLRAIRQVTFCLLLATRVRCEPRIVLPHGMPGAAVAPAPEPITPAALPIQTAYGVLAIAAATLRSLAGRGGRHTWHPDGGTCALTIASFWHGCRRTSAGSSNPGRPAGSARRGRPCGPPLPPSKVPDELASEDRTQRHTPGAAFTNGLPQAGGPVATEPKVRFRRSFDV